MSTRPDPHWGEHYSGSDRPDYITYPDAFPVWMFRRGQRVRFFDADGGQVGPEHANVAPAVVWAAGNGWIDPDNVALSLMCIAEVRAGGTVSQ